PRVRSNAPARLAAGSGETPPPVSRAQTPTPTQRPNPGPTPAPRPAGRPPPAPRHPAAPPAPPAPAAAPAPLTPPSANAGYLHNPAPEYPALAMRRGWEGTVLLRVHVLASGSPSEIQVQKSSGREALDQAAVKAVKRWSFVPAKRGDKAEDGWVSVPIDFKLN
ncbi:energy transducer TonB, partial [Pseudomonas aeruginosa]|uniref:energy transducer TonB n=1 Tax=Pseudomonas aeruginosa TaxID=287 RepID=UPI001E574151